MSKSVPNMAKVAIIGSAAIGVLVLPGCLPILAQNTQTSQQQNANGDPEANANGSGCYGVLSSGENSTSPL